jgi:signal peptidase
MSQLKAHTHLQKNGTNRRRVAAALVLDIAVLFFSAFAFRALLQMLTASPTPVVVVLSGQPPSYERGDILLVGNKQTEFDIGDLVHFRIRGRDVPDVHRIVKVHRSLANVTRQETDYLTKGDDNRVDDRGLYFPGQLWLHREDINGKVIARIPNLGQCAILLWDYPVLFWSLAVSGLVMRQRKLARLIIYATLLFSLLSSGAY